MRGTRAEMCSRGHENYRREYPRKCEDHELVYTSERVELGNELYAERTGRAVAGEAPVEGYTPVADDRGGDEAVIVATKRVVCSIL